MKLLWRWLLIAIIAGIGICIAIWLNNNQGEMRLSMFGYEVTAPIWLSLLALTVILLLIVTPLFLLWQFKMWRGKLKFKRQISKQTSGIHEITQVITSLSLGELKTAEKHLRLAQKTLGAHNELNQLLEAHLLAKSGNYAELNLSFEKMQQNPATKMLARRAMLQSALVDGDIQKAISQAKLLFEDAPKNSTNAVNYLGVLLKNAQFVEAHLLYKTIARAKLFNKHDLQKLQAIIYLSEFEHEDKLSGGIIPEYDGYDELLWRAFDTAPFFAPTHKYLKIAKKNAGGDWKLAQKAWKENPNSLLTDIILQNYADEEKTKLIKWLQKIIDTNPTHVESQILQANIAMLQEDYTAARNYLKVLLANSPQIRIYELLARLEEQSGAGVQAINAWRAKQSEATLNPAWLCEKCGHHHAKWQLECDNCHSFATIDLTNADNIRNQPNIGLLFN
jgi:HemY protein